MDDCPLSNLKINKRSKRYDESVFTSAGIEYLALEIDGGGKIPHEDKVQGTNFIIFNQFTKRL